MRISHRLSAFLITLSLAACGGGGTGSGSAGTGDATLGGGPTPNVLFVGDEGNHGFAALTTLSPTAGSTVAPKVLDVGSVQMWTGIAYDKQRDRLYANNGQSIAEFDQASLLNGRITAIRQITPAIPGLLNLVGMQLDKGSDRLYVSFVNASNAPCLAIIENISTAANGVAPSRILQGIGGKRFVIDTYRNVFYGFDVSHALFALPNLDKASGTIPASSLKYISLNYTQLDGLAIDTTNDRLYVGIIGFSGLAAVSAASTRGGAAGSAAAQTTSAAIALPNGAATAAGLSYDGANDRLYAGLDSRVFVLNAVSKLQSGTAAAVMVPGPANSLITTFAF